ncbi:MAG: Druantia anti-phage system protein DruA [bacterium]
MKKLEPMIIMGRDFSVEELKLIKEMVELYPKLSRTELAKTICENIFWEAPNGIIKHNSCLKALEKLEEQGHIELPVLRSPKSRKQTKICITPRSDPAEMMEGRIDQWGSITIEKTNTKNVGLWNEYIERYHYLGYKIPFGLHQKYFVTLGGRVVACMLYTSSAWALECRDKWIGWSARQKEKNLTRIANMSRFLILPWVRLKNLASCTISLSSKLIEGDWEERFGYKPVLLESFVDATLYKGTCYRAANWIYLGQSKGRGRQDRYNKGLSTIKDVFVYPLCDDFREELYKI